MLPSAIHSLQDLLKRGHREMRAKVRWTYPPGLLLWEEGEVKIDVHGSMSTLHPD